MLYFTCFLYFVIHAVTFHLPMGSCAHGKPGKVLEISLMDTLFFFFCSKIELFHEKFYIQRVWDIKPHVKVRWCCSKSPRPPEGAAGFIISVDWNSQYIYFFSHKLSLFWKKLIHLFIKDALKWSEVSEK